MKIDKSKHELVPVHEILSEEEVEKLLEDLNITKGQLPKMMANDFMAKKIKAKSGDVVRIKRRSETAGESYFYRVVVAE